MAAKHVEEREICLTCGETHDNLEEARLCVLKEWKRGFST